MRRANLLLYWGQMAERRPRLLLVGEAPGYRGCRLTGVPFTSEFVLLNGVEAAGLFGRERGYRTTGEAGRVSREASATVLWEVVAGFQPPPLLWNAFPFHPYQNGNPHSNRRPDGRELTLGEPFLRELITLFAIETVVAVGRTAGEALRRAGIPAALVRHPSHGGKTRFATGLVYFNR